MQPIQKKINRNFILLLSFILIILTAIAPSQLYVFKHNYQLNPELKDTIIHSAAQSLRTLDVPVGAVLLYGNQIIGTGFNTVVRDTNVAGHAEINAINDAITKSGFKAFSGYKRDSLYMLSTFDPCLMCRGALIEYGIRHIIFLKDKTWFERIKTSLKEIRLDLMQRHTPGASLQDSLFSLHPAYHQSN